MFEGRTTGTSLAILIRNEDQRSRDYADIKDKYRPGHADYTFDAKYGFRDYRGGGRSSARETNVRVAAGAVAKKLLHQLHGVRDRRVREADRAHRGRRRRPGDGDAGAGRERTSSAAPTRRSPSA